MTRKISIVSPPSRPIAVPMPMPIPVPFPFPFPVSLPVLFSPPPPLNSVIVTLRPVSDLRPATVIPAVHVAAPPTLRVPKPTALRPRQHARQQPAENPQKPATSAAQRRRDVRRRALDVVRIGPGNAPTAAHVPPGAARRAILEVAAAGGPGVDGGASAARRRVQRTP